MKTTKIIESALSRNLVRALSAGVFVALCAASASATPLCANNVTIQTLKTTNGGICDLGLFYQVDWQSGAYSNANVNDTKVIVSWSNVSLTSLEVDFIANNAAGSGITADTFGNTGTPATPTTNGQSKIVTASINFFYTVTPLNPDFGIIQETIGAKGVEAQDKTSGKAVATTSDFVAQKYVRDQAGDVLGLAVSDGLSATNDVEDLSGQTIFQGVTGPQVIQEQLFLTNRKTKISGTVYSSAATVGTGNGTGGTEKGEITNAFVFANVTVPEPLTPFLAGGGLILLGMLRRKNRK